MHNRALIAAVILFAPIHLGLEAGPLSPSESVKAMRLEPGLRVELVAAEPLVVDPVALAFDERGRMFVAENRDYPTGPASGTPAGGCIALLEDDDGDGFFEKRTTYAGGLTYPNGVLPWKNGLFVTCAPDVFYFKDTNGDGKADEREIVLSGFATNGSTQLRVCYPTLGPDHWIYLASGLVGGKIVSPLHPNRPPLDMARADLRFRPDLSDYELADGKAQFGLAFDDFGRRYICMNRVHLRQVVLESRYLRRNPNLAFSETIQDLPEIMLPDLLRGHGAAARIYPISQNITTADSHAGTFTAACGLLIYRGTDLPSEYEGNGLACDPTGNLVHRDKLIADGATYKARPAREGIELLASADDWFRPVYLANGPDGALYVCDMYRKTIEHPEYLPEEIRKKTNFDSGKGMGRVYRIRADRRRNPAVRPNLHRATAEELCLELAHPNGWWRDTAQRLLLERSDAATVPLLKQMVGGAAFSSNSLARWHALWTLHGLRALDGETVSVGLEDSEPAVRESALKLAEPFLKKAPSLGPKLIAKAGDPDARVRFQAALALGDLEEEGAAKALAQIAVRDCGDRWARVAVLSSIRSRPEQFLGALLAELQNSANPPTHAPALMSELGRVLANSTNANALGVFRHLTSSRRQADLAWQLAGLNGFGDGLQARGLGGHRVWALTVLIGLDSSLTPARLRELGAQSLQIVSDPAQPLPLRQAAALFLGHMSEPDPSAVLIKLLEPGTADPLQRAAVRALGQLPRAEVGQLLLARERWQSYAPGVRDLVLSAMLSEPRHLRALIQALECGAAPLSALSPGQRKQLLENKDPYIREHAAALFQEVESGDRMKVFEEHKSVLALKPDPVNGKAVFKLHCALCHRLDREGIPVGPDLFGIRNQPKEAILLHILVPELEIVPGFNDYIAETKDGRTFSGIIASDTGTSITLRAAYGLEETFLRDNLASLQGSSLSLMPQELEKTMPKQDLADLVSYLKGE